MIQEYIAKLRREYSSNRLDETMVDGDPFLQFTKWLEAAVAAEVLDPHAMVIASASRTAKLSARVVLLRGFDRNGFVFYTNYSSRKGTEMLSNPNASAVFLWREVDRQIRIEGTVEKVSDADSDRYFQSRPRDSQIAAWASSQSQVIASREDLDNLFKEFEKRFDGRIVPRPANWGGFRLKPAVYEFWQGRPGRLHDRILYTLVGQSTWEISRLAP
ncbi:MAG: pyridoxamine 5'-phosphate oxidase [Candidatus Kryptoniota bacterium]